MVTKTNDVYNEIPLSKCEPHPLTVFRFNYSGSDVEELCASIMTKGQLEPGYAVLDEESGKYLIYIGQKRLAALKMAAQKDKKIKNYRAMVSKNISDSDIFARAYVENAVRSDLDWIEKIKLYHTLSNRFDRSTKDEILQQINLTSSKVDAGAKLYDVFTEDVMKSIYDTERKTGFRLTMKHLDEIGKVRTPESMVALADHVCKTQMPATTLASLIDSNALLTILPQLGEPSPTPAQYDTPEAPSREDAREAPSSIPDVPMPKPVNGDWLTGDGYMVKCQKKACGAANFFEATITAKVKFADPLSSPVNTVSSETDVTPDFFVEASHNCWKCGEPMVVKLASVGASGLTGATSRSGELEALADTPVKVSVFCDVDNKKYTVTANDKRYVLDKSGQLKPEGR
ncbi:MAG: ParB N-terminal domain-containing protein [Nitrososphaerota archaeon]|jgi:ParB/RepB/Spo0J family partition protein|nr:ParB N-terminal domain-containing protein [Nitrososphaerota archaeon]MDG6948661.1 ParB N-terminal domain-containing protein [Nitrososphaerota archaeon]